MSVTEYHSVPIPTEDLEAVYELLAARARLRNSTAPRGERRKDVPDRSDVQDEAWTDEMLERIAHGDTISTQVLTDIMDVLVRDPRGQREYNREELVEETGHPAGRVTATFTKLTPHFRKHYGIDWWPIIGQSGADLDPPRPGTYYWMPPALAVRWKRLRSL